jgi:hypothetical protein
VCVCFSRFAVLCWYFGPFAIVIYVWVCHFLPPVFSGFKCLCMCVFRFVALWSVIWSLCDLYVDVLLTDLFRFLVFIYNFCFFDLETPDDG